MNRPTRSAARVFIAMFALAMVIGLTPSPAEATSRRGSVKLSRSGSLDVGASADWNIGTNDFTVEWFAFQTDPTGFSRMFSIGVYPTASIAVSIEDSSVYVWLGGEETIIYNTSVPAYIKRWLHYALTRSDGHLSLYVNGARVGYEPDSTNIDTTGKHLFIGSELEPNTYFHGYLTNFHYVNGTALYSGDGFTVPASTITAVANSKLLLTFGRGSTWLADSSGRDHAVTRTRGASSASKSPFARHVVGYASPILVKQQRFAKIDYLDRDRRSTRTSPKATRAPVG